MILKIASHCKTFSLSKVFITQADLQKVLMQPSPQIIEAFERMAIETEYTCTIETLETSAEESLISFCSDQFKLTSKDC